MTNSINFICSEIKVKKKGQKLGSVTCSNTFSDNGLKLEFLSKTE